MTAADTMRAALRSEITLLRAWARESSEGGWSTHQVDPMRRRADDLEALLAASPPPEGTATEPERK